jgi:hypothetical protein
MYKHSGEQSSQLIRALLHQVSGSSVVEVEVEPLRREPCHLVNLLLTDDPGHDGRLRLPLGEQLVVGVVVLDPTILRQVIA